MVTFGDVVLVRFPQTAPAIGDLLEAGRARARDAFAERLRELFGERLDAPDGRFELELALRTRRLVAAG